MHVSTNIILQAVNRSIICLVVVCPHPFYSYLTTKYVTSTPLSQLTFTVLPSHPSYFNLNGYDAIGCGTLTAYPQAHKVQRQLTTM